MQERRDREDLVSADEQVDKIIESAARLGVEVDKASATQWLADMAAGPSTPNDITVDARAGVFGHRVALLDFDPDILQRYRRLAQIVDVPSRPDVETALSLSGSAAQSRVQLFPGDADFFERVNVLAPSREVACRVVGDVMREKALSTLKGENYELVEVKWGTFEQEVIYGGERIRAGRSMSWSAEAVKAGKLEATTAAGEPLTIDWEYGCRNPGWCKLDWVIVEPASGTVVHASNMLDVTWERPDGDIVPLDGFLDPYFQEVYLDAAAIPLFSKIVGHLSPDAIGEYVEQLRHEVLKYSQRDPRNFGKVAKRLYNIFRLTGHWSEAVFVRELFDEPAALLYQVAALLDTLDEALSTGVSQERDTLIGQTDQLIRAVVRVCDGPSEERVVDALLKLRDDVAGRRALGEARDDLIGESGRLVSDLVNEYFRERLLLMPEVREYIESLEAS
jgi:hypothetical protein